MWSEDDTSDVETSLNLTKICSLNFSVDETDDFQLPVLLSSKNVTVRRKTKKKQDVSEDNTNGKCQSENTLKNLGSPFFDDLNYTLHNSNQENMPLDSIPVKSEFEQAENYPVNCQLSNNFLENNSLKVHLEQKLKNTKLDSPGKEMKWVDWDTTPPCSLAIDANLSSNDVNSSKKSEKFPTSEDIVCNSKGNESDILTNSCRSLKNEKLHKMMCGQIENSDINSYNEPVQSNTRSNIVSVSDETNNVVGQNVVQCTRKIDTPPMNGKQNSSNTEQDPCMNRMRNDNDGYNVEYSGNENKISSTHIFCQNESSINCNENAADLISGFTVGKVKTDLTEKSPLICKLNKNSEDGNDELFSNKENVCIPGSKKKVIILSSDSDSESVWEDVVDSDDSDCKKYDISLSSRLGKWLSLSETTKHTRDTETDDFIKEPKYVNRLK